jgi:transposase
VWCSAGRNYATLQRFFAELGDRKDSIRAVSIDMCALRLTSFPKSRGFSRHVV